MQAKFIQKGFFSKRVSSDFEHYAKDDTFITYSNRSDVNDPLKN